MKLRPVAVCALLVVVIFAGMAHADFQIQYTGPAATAFGSQPRGSFATKEEIYAYMRGRQWIESGNYRIVGSADSGSPGRQDQRDREREERERQIREELERQRAAAEQRWREEEALRRQDQKKRSEEALSKVQAEAVKLLGQRPAGGGAFLDDGLDGDDGLRPGGNSFFGLGGGPGSGKPLSEAPPVDPRHLRKAAYFAQAVDNASAEDLELLLDEALKAANGGASSFGPVPAGAEQPEIDEGGLLAFQKANFEYARAHDLQLICAEALKTTRQQRDLARQKAEAKRAEVERQMAGKTDAESLLKKREILAAIDAELEVGESAARRAEDLAAVADDQAYWNREEAVRVLRALAQGKKPDEFHPPIASLPTLKEETWRKWEERNREETKLLEEQTGKLRKGLASYVPPPQERDRLQLGIILGTGTDAQRAKEMEENGVSCFTGKTFKEMNDAAVKARAEGKTYAAGVKVVSFGTDKSRPENPFDPFRYQKDELGRVVGDHLTRGEVSLSTPEGRQAVAELSGKQYDRLMAHSNGASVTEALIRNDVIEVNELHIVGGDRSLLNGKAYQELLDAGKVKRVVVWYNVNDPIPWVTSADQLSNVGPEAVDEAAHLTKKILGVTAGGNDRVQYRPMVGQDYRSAEVKEKAGLMDKTFAEHYLESSYMPGMANEMGLKYNIPEYDLEGK